MIADSGQEFRHAAGRFASGHCRRNDQRLRFDQASARQTHDACQMITSVAPAPETS
jgi:hypothetical protein